MLSIIGSGRKAGPRITLGICENPNDVSAADAVGFDLFQSGIRNISVIPFSNESLLPNVGDINGPLVRWDYTKPENITRAVGSSTKALLSTPGSLLVDFFTSCLRAFRQTDNGKNVRIHVGISFPRSVDMLKKLFENFGIATDSHAEAGFLLERFERAEQDKRMDFFVDTWTRNCLEWALSLAGADGVHAMPQNGVDSRIIGTFQDVLGLGKHWTGADVLFATKKQILEWESRFLKLPKSTPVRYLPGMLESPKKGGKDYAAEFLPLLEPTHSIIQELQTTHPENPLWTNFSVSFIRMPQNNHAHTLPVEVISDDKKSFRELVIDIRYPGYKTNSDLFKKRLRNTLLSELKNRSVEHHVYLGERGNPPFLYDVLDEGWNEFSHAQTAENKPDVGTSIAKNSIVYERSAQELYESLKNAPDREEYAIAELGVYDANGMPEMLGYLQKLINRDKTNRAMLLERLQRTVFVCVDFAKDGLDSCQKVLAKHPKLTGMFREFKYIEGNIMDDECHGQLNPWKGKFLSIRAINTLCAFPEPSYVVRHNTPYRVEYDTLIDTIELQKLVKDLYPPAVLEPGKKSNHLIYFIDKKEQPSLAEGSVTQESILHALQKAQKVQKNKIGTFTQFLMDEAHIPREAALLIWVRVLHILKKKKGFMSIKDPAEAQHARDVASHHPDTHVPFTLSHHATRFMSHLGSFLDPKSGTAFFASLMSDLSSQYLASHQASHGPATPGITGSQPVQPEPIVTSFTSNGLKLQVIPHRDHPKRTKEKQLRPTVSMMLVKHDVA